MPNMAVTQTLRKKPRKAGYLYVRRKQSGEAFEI
jgi:hypothetical protein